MLQSMGLQRVGHNWETEKQLIKNTVVVSDEKQRDSAII